MSNLILLVEDDRDIRTDLAQILTEEGFEVATAGNGLEALRYLTSAARPRLILLDLMMPVMDGWQLRLELLGDPVLAAIPIVLLSGAGHLNQEVASLQAAGCLSKPFRIEQLLRTIDRICTVQAG